MLAELPFPFLNRTAQLQSPFFQGSSCRRRLGDDRVRVRIRDVAMLLVSVHSDAANAADVLLTEGCVSAGYLLLRFINAASEACSVQLRFAYFCKALISLILSMSFIAAISSLWLSC